MAYLSWKERGSVVGELTVVVPLFLVLLGASIDFSLAFFSAHVLENAAREGARIAVTLPGLQVNETIHEERIRQVVLSRLANTAQIANFQIDIDGPRVLSDDPTGHEMIRVTVRSDFMFHFLRFIGFGSMELSRTSTMRYEWQSPVLESDNPGYEATMGMPHDDA